MPSAIRVAEPLVSYPLWVFTSIPDIKASGWNSLAKYKIVTVTGWLYINEKLGDFKTLEVATPKQALRILNIKRAEVFISDQVTAAGIMSGNDFDGSGIVKLEKPIDFIHEYTYFSAKYPELASAYNIALIELKTSGKYAEVFNNTK